MTIIGMLVVLVIVGVVLWMVNTIIPMDARIKTVLNVVVLLMVCIWLLESFGLFSGFGNLNRPVR